MTKLCYVNFLLYANRYLMNEVFPKNMTVKQAVLATLAYFDLFGVPLTRSDISEHLFFTTPDEEKIDIYLRESPIIRLKEGYYSISGTDEFYDTFLEKRSRALEYWKKVRRYHWLFSVCPFIDLICVCNSLPIYAIDEESDIDLFVIAKKNRLFLARFALTLLTTLFGVRRHGTKTKARFCLSFYVTEDNLDLKKISREPYDIYLAYWIKTMEPIAGNFETYQKILDLSRHWLSDYFKTVQEHRRYFRKAKPWHEQWKERFETWLDKDSWEEKAKRSQLLHAREKYLLLKDKSGTILASDMLKFHDTDERETFRTKWVNRLNELL